MPRFGLLHLLCRSCDIYQRPHSCRPSSHLYPTTVCSIETDSPYLSPHPWRGREHRNEPARVAIIAARLAELKGISVEAVGHVTTDNFQTLFPRARSLS